MLHFTKIREENSSNSKTFKNFVYVHVNNTIQYK